MYEATMQKVVRWQLYKEEVQGDGWCQTKEEDSGRVWREQSPQTFPQSLEGRVSVALDW